MRRKAFLVVLAAIAFLGPTSSAAPIEGRLDWNGLAVATGIVTMTTGTVGSNVVARLAPDAVLPSNPVLRSDLVRVTLHEWANPSNAPGPAVEDPLRQVSEDLHEVRIFLQELHALPQIFADYDPRDAPARAASEIGPATCRLSSAWADPWGAFAQGQLTPPDGLAGEAGASMASHCAADGFNLESPSHVYFYGMRVLLESREGPRTYDTGPLGQPLDREPFRASWATVTQVLEVSWLGEPVEADVPMESNLIGRAPGYAVIGSVQVPSASGWLSWGPHVVDGDLDAFDAEGEFLFAANSDETVSMTGRTINEPPEAASGSSAASLQPGASPSLLVAAAAGGAALLAWLLWPLFSRLAPDKVRDHPRRAAILQVVQATPGVHATAVARAVGIRPAKAQYHVRLLERSGDLTVHRVGGMTALFPARRGYRGTEVQVALLRRPPLVRIVEALRAEPGLDQEELARRLGVARSQVSRGIDRLEAGGLVRSTLANRRRRYSAVGST